ncbi:MAG TPA: hypothetical protein VMW94_03395, partial [Actinomycetes bacterium]|nr:hypothetical protein [Actinomycetes bacterium]
NGTDERTRLLSAYQSLTSDGLPDNGATELAAMKLAFGPLPGSVPKDETARSRETDQTGEGGGAGASATNDGTPLGNVKMPAKQREYYDSLIAKNIMTAEQAAAEYKGYQTGRGRARTFGQPRQGRQPQ